MLLPPTAEARRGCKAVKIRLLVVSPPGLGIGGGTVTASCLLGSDNLRHDQGMAVISGILADIFFRVVKAVADQFIGFGNLCSPLTG